MSRHAEISINSNRKYLSPFSVDKNADIFATISKFTRIFNGKIKDFGAMKNIRHITKGDAVDNRMEISNHQIAVPKAKLSSGSVADKYPVLLDDGRTVVYIKDKSQEREVRLRYAQVKFTDNKKTS
jgi:hypothetical protein